ncbi:MAG TPA: NIPSNAP family protein [Pirellulales bacterium]
MHVNSILRLRRRQWLPLISAAPLLCIAILSAGSPARGEEHASQTRIFELRTYHTHPGRLDALNRRFREHTNRIFAKHGMTIIGFWTPTEGPDKDNKLVYMLAFTSREAADAAWNGFKADPEWKAAKAASEQDGPIVKKVISEFLQPTDYSPIK